jgi:perosamine synthetase
MINLIPRDHWEYRVKDFFKGIGGIIPPAKRNSLLTIDAFGQCIPVGTGRAGLVAAIRSLDLPNGAKVAVPLYCCHVVFQAIVTAGCKPCFIDIDPETFCLSPNDLSNKISDCSAVIAVHMFGNTCDMVNVKATAQGRPVIEDCAQALGSKIDGQSVGTFGDISFFSFRSGKYVSAGEGGAVYSKKYLSKIGEIISKMPQPSLSNELSHTLRIHIKSMLRSKPLYGIFGYKLWSLASKRTNPSEDGACTLIQIHNSDLNIATNRLPGLHSLIERQRANANLYSILLNLAPKMLCHEKPNTYYNRYLYPIKFHSQEQRDVMATFLLSRNIDTMKYLDDIVQIAKKYFAYSSTCPIAEELSKKVLIIPSYYSLPESDIRYIANHINNGWNQIGKYRHVA